MEDNEAISSVKLNKICSAERFTFNLCISLNHFMIFEYIAIEGSHSRNVWNIESVVEHSCNIKFLEFLLGNDHLV